MLNIFIAAMLGHFVADYLFQPRAMALKKSEKGWSGFGYCLLHCFIYVLAVAIFTGKFQPIFLALVFLSHFPIDRWSFATHWLKLIRGRDLIDAHNSKSRYREIEISFAALVYTVTDNTMHIVLLWLIITHLF